MATPIILLRERQRGDNIEFEEVHNNKGQRRLNYFISCRILHLCPISFNDIITFKVLNNEKWQNLNKKPNGVSFIHSPNAN